MLPMGVRRVIVRWFAPSYTVGALCVIEDDDGRILLVRQIHRDDWGIPGGLAKRGEDLADAARREVFEEIGVAVELIGPPAVVVDPVPRRVDVVHRARVIAPSRIDDVRPSSVEIVEAQWFTPDAFPPLQTETIAALDAVARGRRRGD